MSQDVTDLSPKQLQAIDLYVSGVSTGNISRMLDVHRQTLWRWRQMAHFDAACREGRAQLLEELRGQMREVLRLSLASAHRELLNAERDDRPNPILTALTILRMATYGQHSFLAGPEYGDGDR